MQLTKHWAATLDDYVIDSCWSPTGSLLAAASAAGEIKVFDALNGEVTHRLTGHEGGTNALAWSPEGRLLASGGQDGAVRLWDPLAGQHLATIEIGGDWVEHLAWQPRLAGSGSTSLLAAGAGRTLRFVRADGAFAHPAILLPKTMTALAWHPSGATLATACFGSVKVWNPNTFAEERSFPYANGIQALVWSPDGNWLVSGNQDPSVHLWVPAKELELHMSGYETKVKHLSFDQHSRWLATSGGRDACLWDCSGAGPEGRDPQMLPHDERVCAVAFQAQHGLLASGSEDGVVMLWSPERKQPLRATVKMPKPPTRITWSPDDQYLAVGTTGGVVYTLKCLP